MLRFFFLSWLSLVLLSFCMELVSQYDHVAENHATQHNWHAHCKKPVFYDQFKQDCIRNTSKSPTPFAVQLLEAVLRHVKWCGVDQCESLLTWKGIMASSMMMAVTKSAPKIMEHGLQKLRME